LAALVASLVLVAPGGGGALAGLDAAGGVSVEVPVGVLADGGLGGAAAGKTPSVLGLNNGFGSDARTRRVITWLMPTSARLTQVRVLVTPAGRGFSSSAARVVKATSTSPGGALRGYRAFTARLTRLTPGTRYLYRLTGVTSSSAGKKKWRSGVYSFATAGAAERDFVFLALADSQGSAASYDKYWGHTLRRAVAAQRSAAFVLHAGDMVDNASSAAEVTAWVRALGGALASPGFFPVLGNHEVGKKPGRVFSQLFPRGSVGDLPLTYAFEYSNALIIGLNTNRTDAATLAQLGDWVGERARAFRARGEGAGAGRERFVIVLLHKSPFGGWHSGETLEAKGDTGTRNLRRYLAPRLEEAGVDLVIAGHDHNYIRSFPIRAGEPQRDVAGARISAARDGLVYMIPRNSGGKTYPVVPTSAEVRPWINRLWNPGLRTLDPSRGVYASVRVTAAALEVVAWTAGEVEIDRFEVTHDGAGG